MVTAGSADGIILSGVAREMEAVPRAPWKLRRRKCLDYTPSVPAGAQTQTYTKVH